MSLESVTLRSTQMLSGGGALSPFACIQLLLSSRTHQEYGENLIFGSLISLATTSPFERLLDCALYYCYKFITVLN